MSNNKIGYIPQMPICNKNTTLELNSDFSLPDYQPEIRRLLSTRVNILPPNEYVGQDSVEFSGEINYHIIYIGSDGELYRATLSDTYSFSYPFDERDEHISADDVVVFADCSTEALSTRVLAPRKLNIRARLECSAKAFCPQMLNVRKSGECDAESGQHLLGIIPVRMSYSAKSEPMILSDFISLENAEGGVRVVDHDCKVFVSEALAYDGKISCKGELCLKLLYCNENEGSGIFTLNKKIPFSCAIDDDRIDSEFECVCRGFVSEEKLDIEENGISCEITVDLLAKAQKNGWSRYIEDSYSTKRKSDCQYSKLEYIKAVKCVSGNITQNESTPLAKLQAPSDVKIIDVNGMAEAKELTVENGKITVKGDCTYQVLYCKEEYGVSECTFPFKCDFDARTLSDKDTESLIWSCNAEIVSSRGRADENNFYVDAELALAVEISEKDSTAILSEITYGDELQKEKSQLVICYPEKGETVWSVAKRYGERLDKVKTQNNIPDGETLTKKKFLII